MPCVTDYLEHIVKSLKNNYQIDLNSAEGEDPELDPDLVSDSMLAPKYSPETRERDSDFTHKTEIKKAASDIFGETFTIHKKISEF